MGSHKTLLIAIITVFSMIIVSIVMTILGLGRMITLVRYLAVALLVLILVYAIEASSEKK